MKSDYCQLLGTGIAQSCRFYSPSYTLAVLDSQLCPAVSCVRRLLPLLVHTLLREKSKRPQSRRVHAGRRSASLAPRRPPPAAVHLPTCHHAGAACNDSARAGRACAPAAQEVIPRVGVRQRAALEARADRGGEAPHCREHESKKRGTRGLRGPGRRAHQQQMPARQTAACRHTCAYAQPGARVSSWTEDALHMISAPELADGAD